MFAEIAMPWWAVVVLKIMEILWKKDEPTWKVYEPKLERDVWVNLKDYLKYYCLQEVKEYIFWSWHFVWKVVKEVWSVVVLVKIWQLYWSLPVNTSAEMEKEVMKCIFLKTGCVALQVHFNVCRINKAVGECRDKLAYMEKRQSKDAADERGRWMMNSLMEYDEDKGHVIWLERSLRSYFDKVMEAMKAWTTGGADSEETAPDWGWWGFWRLLATEVLMRHCRDVLQQRAGYIAACLADGGAKMDEYNGEKSAAAKKYIAEQKTKMETFRNAPMETVKNAKKKAEEKWWGLVDAMRFLKNLSLKTVEFYKPLETMDDWRLCSWKKIECCTPQEWSLKHQLMERKLEISAIMRVSCVESREQVEIMKDYLMEGMPPLMQSLWKEVNETGGSSTQVVASQAAELARYSAVAVN